MGSRRTIGSWKDARERLNRARSVLNGEDYAAVIRESQARVERMLKSLLDAPQVDYMYKRRIPHDVSKYILKAFEKLSLGIKPGKIHSTMKILVVEEKKGKGLRDRLGGRHRSRKQRMHVVRVEEKTKVKFPPFLEFQITREKKPSRKAKASDRSTNSSQAQRDAQANTSSEQSQVQSGQSSRISSRLEYYT